jgi:hypothetical protein
MEPPWAAVSIDVPLGAVAVVSIVVLDGAGVVVVAAVSIVAGVSSAFLPQAITVRLIAQSDAKRNVLVFIEG